MNIIRSHSPQHPDDLVVEVPEATPAEVATAATRARHAQPAWAAAPAATRAAALGSIADDVAAAAGGAHRPRRARGRQTARRSGRRGREVRGDPALLRPTGVRPDRSGPRARAPEPRWPTPVGGPMASPGSSRRGTSPSRFRSGRPPRRSRPATRCCSSPRPQATAAAQRLGDLIARQSPRGCSPSCPAMPAPERPDRAAADVVSFTGSAAVGASRAPPPRRGVPVQSEMGGQNPAIVLAGRRPRAGRGAHRRLRRRVRGPEVHRDQRIIASARPPSLCRSARREAARADGRRRPGRHGDRRAGR